MLNACALLCLVLAHVGTAQDLGGLGDLLAAMGGAQGGRGGNGKKRSGVCPKGKFLAPVNALDLTPDLTANGCGPAGMKVEEKWGLFKCCNRHDICYTFCETKYKECEREFSTCMQDICKQQKSKRDQKDCSEEAQGFSSMTGMFGSGFHMSAQRNSCECVDSKEEALQRKHDLLLDFFSRHDPEQATEEQVSGLMEKWKGKLGKLYMELAIKYGKAFVTFDGIKDEL